jgi:hypothetical protein
MPVSEGQRAVEIARADLVGVKSRIERQHIADMRQASHNFAPDSGRPFGGPAAILPGRRFSGNRIREA